MPASSLSYYPGSDRRLNVAIYYSNLRYAQGDRLLGAIERFYARRRQNRSVRAIRAAARAYIQYRRARSV